MREWYSIKNEADTVEILIYGVIGEDYWGDGVSAAKFAQDLSSVRNVQTINARINSVGGNVMEGTAIYNTLVNHSAAINIIIDGWAISAASFIAMAGAGEGNSITMAENGMMMIHKPWAGSVGTADDLRKTAEMMDKAEVNIIKTYQSKVDKTDDELATMMAEETWMTGQEALDHGFVDSLTGSANISNNADNRIFNSYKNIPAGLMNLAPVKAELVSGAGIEVPVTGTFTLANGRSVGHLAKEIDLLEID
ncbi:MAG: head maturation protease, ClpP-related [Desulfobacterales bacterium]